jgi:hypothetical protein
MVRTLKLSHVASGSYYNLSQGIFDTIRFEKQTQPSLEITASRENTLNEAIIYPNPSTGLFIISFGLLPVQQATIRIYNLQGKIVHVATFENTALEKI